MVSIEAFADGGTDLKGAACEKMGGKDCRRRSAVVHFLCTAEVLVPQVGSGVVEQDKKSLAGWVRTG